MKIHCRIREDFDEYGGGDGGGGISAPPLPNNFNTIPEMPASGDSPPASSSPADVPSPHTPQPASPQSQSISIDTLRQLLPMMQQSQPAQAPQPEPEMTPEQLRQYLGYPNLPAPEVLASAYGLSEPDAAHKMLSDMVESIVQHQYRTMGVFQDHINAQIQQMIAPALQSQREESRNTFVSNVSRFYPGFSGYDQIVHTVMDHMAASGYQPQSEVAAYQDVAARAAQLIKSINPGFNPSVAQQQTAAPQTMQSSQRGMPQMQSSFMQPSGGGAAAPGSTSKPMWMKAFKR